MAHHLLIHWQITLYGPMRRWICMEMTLFFRKQNRDLAAKVAYAVISGVCGTLVLIIFFLLFIDVFRLLKFVPWMIAFNTAMTGYSLIDKNRGRITRKHLAAVCAGLVNVAITCGLLRSLSIYFLGENLLGLEMFFFLLLMGAVCSDLGALLAAKYFRIR